MAKKIGIVGSQISDDELKLFNDEYKLWGTNNIHEKFPSIKWDRWFEIHKIEEKENNDFYRRGYNTYPIDSSQSVYKYLNSLNYLDCPVYMREKWSFIRNSTKFPFKRLLEKYGDYMGCSFAFMTALAIDIGADEIAYFGVQLSGCEYYYQRPSTEYLIGLAKGKGIDIYIHNSSFLLTSNYVYAWDERPREILALHTDFMTQLSYEIISSIQQHLNKNWKDLGE